jgi:hypothetical protein
MRAIRIESGWHNRELVVVALDLEVRHREDK